MASEIGLANCCFATRNDSVSREAITSNAS